MPVHHITAIAGDPQRNLDFYAGLLGLRLVKLTVNFDDPASYHFYYGDELGRPGSLLTFFPWPDGRPGRQGTGQIATVALVIPFGALGFWVERLLGHGIRFKGPARRFDEQVLALSDPDGLLLELVATPGAAEIEPWSDGPVPPEHSIRGLHGATIWEDRDYGSAQFLSHTLGFDPAGEDGGLVRYQAAGSALGTVINLRRAPGFWSGSTGVGTVHHMAFRAATDAEQLERRAGIEGQGLSVTPVVDRQYFHSVYFREPGGVLFEIATDGPGFTIDEPAAELGSRLRLPPMYQTHQKEIERALPPLRLPQTPAEQSR